MSELTTEVKKLRMVEAETILQQCDQNLVTISRAVDQIIQNGLLGHVPDLRESAMCLNRYLGMCQTDAFRLFRFCRSARKTGDPRGSEEYSEALQAVDDLRRQLEEAREELRKEQELPTHLLDVHAIADERDELRRQLEGVKMLIEKLVEIHDASGGDWNAWQSKRSSDWFDEVTDLLSKEDAR
jgi:hypothetical protein